MRCRAAIRFGALATRCTKDSHPTDPEHQANGLAEFPYQRVVWFDGDRRQYLTDEDHEHAWEVGQP